MPQRSSRSPCDKAKLGSCLLHESMGTKYKTADGVGDNKHFVKRTHVYSSSAAVLYCCTEPMNHTHLDDGTTQPFASSNRNTPSVPHHLTQEDLQQTTATNTNEHD